MAVGKNITWKGGNIILLIIFGCSDEYQVGKGGRGRKFWVRKSRFKKKWGWGRISSCREFYTPLFYCLLPLVKDVTSRASYSELLDHPFLANKPEQADMAAYIDEILDLA